MPDVQENAGIKRNPDGTFPKGVSGNPKGMPKFSIISILKEHLKEVPPGEKKARVVLLVEQILQKAINEKDTAMMRDILDRIDGKPKQDTDVNIANKDGEPFVVVTRVPETL